MMSNEDKRFITVFVLVIFAVALFIATATAISDRTFAPLIVLGAIVLVIIVFVTFMLASGWLAVKIAHKLFPSSENDKRTPYNY